MAATESKPTNGNSDAGAEVSPLEKQIIEQIEYYFSDINLARDKFLQGEIRKEDGWVELATMLKFARLAKITTEAKVIADALKKSTSNLMKVNEDDTKIRRNPENALPTFDNEFVKELIAQSLYLKFIPLDATLDDIKEFLKKNTSEDTKINNIIMRYYQDKLANQKKFKGSIFVTFDSKDNAEKFLNENKDKELKFNENCEKSLLIKWQQEYHEEKKQEVRSKRDKNRKHEGDGSDDVKEESKKVLLELPKGALLKVTNVKEPISREDIREVLEKVKTEEELIVDFIEFQQGDVTAYVRYKKEGQAEAALKALGSAELEVKEVKVNVEVISGEEEQTVLDRMKIDIFKRRQKLMNEKKGGRKFGKKGPRGFKRGSRGGNSDHHNKRAKVE